MSEWHQQDSLFVEADHFRLVPDTARGTNEASFADSGTQATCFERESDEARQSPLDDGWR